MDNKYKVISTFSGIGGSSQGYKQAGLNVIASVEFLDYQANTYRLNHPNTKLYEADIRTLDPLKILSDLGLKPGELDIFDGSPPCSSFSTNGIISEGWGKVKDYGNKEQRTDDLFYEYIRFLRVFKPKVFVAENVSGLIKGKSKGHFNNFLTAFKESGYAVSAKLLNAANYGVPQIRQRLIFIGVRNDLNLQPCYPTPLSTTVSVYSAIKDLPVDLSEDLSLSESQLRYWKTTQVGESLDKSYHKETGKVGWFSLLKIHPNKPCNTLTTGCSYQIYHWSEPRKFYLSELRAIQSFPAEYKFTGDRRRIAEGLGRSVPPKMMEAIARTIKTEILDKISLV